MVDVLTAYFPAYSSRFGSLRSRLEAMQPDKDQLEDPAAHDKRLVVATHTLPEESSMQSDRSAQYKLDQAPSAMEDIKRDMAPPKDFEPTCPPLASEPQLLLRTDTNQEQNSERIHSLLPVRLIAVLNEFASNWHTVPLVALDPDLETLKKAQSVGLWTLGDLSKPSVLSVLAFASPLDSQEVSNRGFWAAVHERAQQAIAGIIEAKVRDVISRTIAEPVIDQWHHAPTSKRMIAGRPRENSTPYDGLSALFSSLEDVMQMPPSGRFNSYRIRAASDSADCQPVPAPRVNLYKHPLLATSVQAKLQAKGCPLARVPLTALALSVRTHNALERAGIRYVSELVACTPEDLLTFRNFGITSYNDAVTQLRAYLDPWLSQLSPEQLAPAASLSEVDINDDVDTKTESDIPSLREYVQSAHPVATEVIPIAELARWFDESRLPSLLAMMDVDWRQLRLRDVLESTAGWDADDVLLDGTLRDFLQVGIVVTSFAPWRVAGAREFAAGLREGLIRFTVTRLLSGDDSIDIVRDTSHNHTLAELFAILAGPTAANLRPRELEIVNIRAGLSDGLPVTLQETGRRFDLTRERVRQLEKHGHDRLTSEEAQPFTYALGDLVRAAVHAQGGAATVAATARSIASWLPFGGLHPEAATRLLASWSPELIQADRDVLVESSYTLEIFNHTRSAIRQVLEARHGIYRDDLIEAALAAGGETVMSAGSSFVAAVLDTMTDVVLQRDIYRPARRGALQARIVQAMRSLGRPAHFTEIAAEYRRLFPDDSKRRDNSVHAFFDRFPKTFVLVGSGIYALAEWGYDPHITTVSSLVEQILEQSERPLHADEITEQGTQRYYWKTNSLLAQLSTNPRIRPFGNGFFGFKDRDYGQFDPYHAYEDVFGESRDIRERLVVGAFTNVRGHRVIQIRLTPSGMRGAIRIVSRPLREIFPAEGAFLSECYSKQGTMVQGRIGRSKYDLHRLQPFFSWADAQKGDYLFIEQLRTPFVSSADAIYRLAFASPEDTTAARRLVGLSAETAYVVSMNVLHYARDPERAEALVTYALAHPWFVTADVNTALGYVPSSPHGADYLRLGLAGAFLAVESIASISDHQVIRPTQVGRFYRSQHIDSRSSGRLLAWSLPAYRQHLRVLADSREANRQLMESLRLLGEAVTRAWDRAYSITRPEDAAHALDSTPCLLSTSSLDSASMPCVLLLLAAQSHGQGIAGQILAAHDVTLWGNVLRRLQSVGIAVITDDAGRIGLAEPVNLAVASMNTVVAQLQESSTEVGTALANAWVAAYRDARPAQAVSAADLYAALELREPELFHALLVPPPSRIPERVQFRDAKILSTEFPTLSADWGLMSSFGDQPPFAFLRHADALVRQQPVNRVAISLTHDLLAQEWDPPRHLAANAHLALLVLLAGDLGDLADQLTLSDAGWTTPQGPLVPRLDEVLRALGYDVWDDLYRGDHALQSALADQLVTLGVRLGLLEVTGSRMEAVGQLASAVYYGGYDMLAPVRKALTVLA